MSLAELKMTKHPFMLSPPAAPAARSAVKARASWLPFAPDGRMIGKAALGVVKLWGGYGMRAADKKGRSSSGIKNDG